MKRKLLLLSVLILSFSKIFAAIDIVANTDVLIFKPLIYTAEPVISNSDIFLYDRTNKKDLKEGTDYTLEIKQNEVNVDKILNVGDYELVFTGKGDYEGAKTSSINIDPADLNSVAVSGVNTSYPYTGSAINPEISVTLNGIAVSSDNYKVTYDANKDVSTGGKVTLTPVGDNFIGQKVVSFQITPVDISTATVTLNPDSYTYTGSAIVPTVQSVAVNSLTLASTDYTVNNAPVGTNTQVGNGSVTLTGKGNFTGSVSKAFTITAADLTTATITLNPASYVYTGSPIQPTTTVTLNQRTLTENTDYTVDVPADGENTNVGNGTFKITGINNYTGAASKDFTITPATLTKEMFVAIATKKYTGSAITLEAADITTSFNSKPLVFGTDYTISGYLNNTDATDDTNKASVTFTGAGNFEGEVTVNFEIHQAPLTADMFTISDQPFTGSAIMLDNDDITTDLRPDIDFEILEQNYTNNVNAGTATVIINGKGDYSGSVPVNFTITPAMLTADMFIKVEPKTYTGSDITLTSADITATSNSVPLVFGTDYVLGAYSENINAGTNTASVVVSGKGNYQGDATVNFTIAPAALDAHMFTIANKPYTGSEVQLADADITATNGAAQLVSGTDYTLGTYTANTNVGKATVNITGAGNYTGTVPVEFTITPATITADQFSAIASKPYTGSAINLTAADITSSLVFGTDYTIGYYDSNINAGTASVVFNGAGNYTGTTTPVNFTITAVSMDNATITIPKQYYTGSRIQPQPVVKIGDVVLLNNNYTVTYPDTQTGAYIQPGTYNVKIDAVANGNLSGSKTVTFQIINAPETYHTITIPQVEGITTDPEAGTYDVDEGDYFTFYITIDDEQNPLRAGNEPAEHVIVKANGVEMNPIDLGNGRYRATINDIEEDITIEIILKEEPPVSNSGIDKAQIKVYSSEGLLYVETADVATIQVYTVTGRLQHQQKNAGGLTTISLTSGIYIVKVNQQTFKVIVK